jgi:hypothetical protein
VRSYKSKNNNNNNKITLRKNDYYRNRKHSKVELSKKNVVHCCHQKAKAEMSTTIQEGTKRKETLNKSSIKDCGRVVK